MPLTLTPVSPGNLFLIAPYPLSAIAVFNVKDYGARGDGSTDDTSYIQAALDAANAAGGGTVLFPKGTYLITATLSVYSNTVLLGWSRATLKIKDNVGGSRDPRILTIGTSQSNVMIDGLILDGNTAGYTTNSFTGGAIHMGNNVDGIWVQNCEIKNFRTWGIATSTTTGTLATNVNISNNYVHDGESTSQAVGMFLAMVSGARVIGNRVYNTTDDGIALISPRASGGTGNASTDYCRDVVIAGNICDTNGYRASGGGSGIVLTGTRITCVGNVVRNCNANHTSDTGNYAIRARHSDPDLDEYVPTEYVIANNVVTDFKVGGIMSHGVRALVTDNTVKGAGTCYGYGIQILHSGTSPQGGNGSHHVINNVVEAAGLAGLWISDASAYDELRVESNTITGCGSRGMRIQPGTHGPTLLAVRNNTVKDNTGDGIYIDGTITRLIVDRNDVIGNTGYGINVGTATVTTFAFRPGIDKGNSSGSGAPNLSTVPGEPLNHTNANWASFGDAVDPTKKLTFDLNGMTTGKKLTVASGQTTDQTVTLPNITRAETLAIQPGTGALSGGTPGDPTGTASTTYVMMGLAAAITPRITGRVFVLITGNVANNTSGDGAGIDIRQGTGTAPVNGAAVTGNNYGGEVAFTAAANNQKVPFVCQGIITGLTLGTAIWIDLALKAVTGGTASLSGLSVTAWEL